MKTHCDWGEKMQREWVFRCIHFGAIIDGGVSRGQFQYHLDSACPSKVRFMLRQGLSR